MKNIIGFALTLFISFSLVACRQNGSQQNGNSNNPSKCEITFKNYDSSVLFYTSVDYGGTAVYQGEEPTRPSTEKYTYTFIGWDKPLEKITVDTVFIAQYRQNDAIYDVSWVIEGNTQTEQYKYGEIPVYKGGEPTKVGNEQYSYVFSHWSPTIVPVTGPATYYAEFSSNVNQYTISWLNDDNSLLENETYYYGSIPTYKGETPVKSGQYIGIYNFIGWSPNIDIVTNNASYVAMYEKILTPIEKYGTEHAGTLNDPLTNEDAILVANSSSYENEELYVGGIVLYILHIPGSRNDGAVSWFLTPAEGQTEKFEVFKCYKQGSGESSYLTDADVWKGGYAIAYGVITKYNTQCEFLSSTFVSCEGQKPEPNKVVTKTFSEALEFVKTLEEGESTYDYINIQNCFVTQKNNKNYLLTATKNEEIHESKDNTIQLYNVMDESVLAKISSNAQINITMKLKNYHGQVENSLIVQENQIEVVVAGIPWNEIPEPDVATKTLAEFLYGDNTKSKAFLVTAKIQSFNSGTTKNRLGNMTLTDDTNILKINGSTVSASSLVWDGCQYSFTNPSDFTTKAFTSNLQIGDQITMKLIRSDQSTVIQAQGIIIVE